MRSDQRRVGERIRRLRQERGLAQREVAEPELSGAYLSLIESGSRLPSERALRHIASRLGVDAEELMSGKPTGTEARLELQLQQARAAAFQGRSREAEESLMEVERETRRFGVTGLQAKALTLAGAMAMSLDDVEGASDYFDDALRLLANAPAHHRFEAIVGLAQVNHAQGDTRLAVHLLESYLTELRHGKVEDPAAVMRVKSALVHYYRALGLARQASEAAEDAIRLSPHVEDPEQLACMSMNVARALYEDGRHDDAVDALKRAEQLYQMLDWPLQRIRARVNKGIVQHGKGNLDGARESFRGALVDLENFPAQKLVRADVLNELARVERLLGNTSEAVAMLTEARKFLTRANLIERAFNAREMGLCLAGSDRDAASAELRRAARDYGAAGAAAEAAKSLLELGRLLREAGEDAEAAVVLQEGLELAAT